VTLFVRSADGRRQLGVHISGNPVGHPVFFLHGTPGSWVGPVPRQRILYDQGIKLISFDRAGYGSSDRLLARTVADVVPDVVAIADSLGIGQFAVLGRSGGGPHALACAALLPGRVTRASALVSLAPPDADRLNWFDGMADSNVDAYTTAAADPELLTARLVQAAAKIKANPTSHVAGLGLEMPAPDRLVVADAGIRAMLAQNFAEALRTSADGWIDDVLAFSSPWGFDVSAIDAPVVLWHGEDDVFSPVAHTQWLARRIPTAHMEIRPGSAHFGALEVLPDILSWLIRPMPVAT
jgi:pimeloyl-ACP methyl ester carboxylesterase